MKKILFCCLKSILKTPSKPLPLAEQNKQLLRGDLKKCYTLDDILILQRVCTLSARYFTLNELIEFNLEVNYRLHLINLAQEKHGSSIYSTPTIYGLFKAAQSIAECEALILHIEQNAKLYRSDLTIFYNMFHKRTSALISELYAQSA